MRTSVIVATLATLALAVPTSGQGPIFTIPEETVHQYLNLLWGAPVRFIRDDPQLLGPLCRAYDLLAAQTRQELSRQEFVGAWQGYRYVFAVRERTVGVAIYDEARTTAKVPVSLVIVRIWGPTFFEPAVATQGSIYTLLKETENWRILLSAETVAGFRKDATGQPPRCP